MGGIWRPESLEKQGEGASPPRYSPARGGTGGDKGKKNMRLLLAGLVGVIATGAIAQDSVMQEEAIPDDATIAAVAVIATRGYASPEAAEIRNVHLSFARNGLGYCGEVTVEGGGGFTPFHVILADGDAAASVLRLSDFPGEALPGSQAENVQRMFRNFGCVEE